MATFTASDLTAVETAIISGALSVRFSDGRQYQYRSIDELLRVRDLINAEIAATAGASRRRTIRLQQSGSGL